jgi:hypothetical protein
MILTRFVSPASMQEIAENVFQPDVVAGYEFLEHHRRKGHLQPEKDLMLAVLADAVRCYRASDPSRSSSSRRLHREAEKWLWNNDRNWLFSFGNICEVLGLDPYFLRRGLLRWKQAQSGADPKAQPKVHISRRRAA